MIVQIHKLQKERDLVDFVLDIAEYGYTQFFHDYWIFLKCQYGDSTLKNLYFNEAMDIYTDPSYSQLWRGLDLIKVKRPRQKSADVEWYERLVLGQVENGEPRPKEKTFNLSDILK